MLPHPAHPASRGLAQTIGDQLHLDPAKGLLGNVASNVGGAVGRMRERDSEMLSSYKMQRALADYNGRPQAVDLGGIPQSRHPWVHGQLPWGEQVKMGESLEALHDPLAAWKEVPEQVAARIRELRPKAIKLAAAAAAYTGPSDRVYWHPQTNNIWVESPFTKESEVNGNVEIRPGPPVPDDGNWVMIKAADLPYAPLERARDAFQAVESGIGGPNPLTASLVGGGLGGLIGYGAGTALEQVLPEEVVRRNKLRKTMGAVGALGGAVPGMWLASGNARDPGSTSALFSAHPFQKKADDDDNDFGGSGLFLKSIPVDAFNRAVWNDVRKPQSAFGSKSPWGDNSQAMGTPPWAAATVSGLVAGAGAATGQDKVSPWQVGIAAAQSAGAGLATGWAVGKLLGTLAGLTPKYQGTLQQAGLWGGLVTGAVKSLFDR